MWEDGGAAERGGAGAAWRGASQAIPEQYMVLVMCRDEKQQVELLARFAGEGLEVKALLS